VGRLSARCGCRSQGDPGGAHFVGKLMGATGIELRGGAHGDNVEAQKFYLRLGFTLRPAPGPRFRLMLSPIS
jgi:hypothetical protein